MFEIFQFFWRDLLSMFILMLANQHVRNGCSVINLPNIFFPKYN